MTVEFHTAIAPHRFFIPRKQLYKLKLTAFLKLRKEKKKRGRQRDINCKMPKPHLQCRNKIPSWVFHQLWDRDAEPTAPEASRSLGFADPSALKHHRFNRNKSPFLYEDVKIYRKLPRGMKLDQTSGQHCTKQRHHLPPVLSLYSHSLPHWALLTTGQWRTEHWYNFSLHSGYNV